MKNAAGFILYTPVSLQAVSVKLWIPHKLAIAWDRIAGHAKFKYKRMRLVPSQLINASVWLTQNHKHIDNLNLKLVDTVIWVYSNMPFYFHITEN